MLGCIMRCKQQGSSSVSRHIYLHQLNSLLRHNRGLHLRQQAAGPGLEVSVSLFLWLQQLHALSVCVSSRGVFAYHLQTEKAAVGSLGLKPLAQPPALASCELRRLYVG